MIKHIIAMSDIHVRNYTRMDELEEQLQKAVDWCREFVSDKNPEEVRIVLAGDIYDKKITVSNESIIIVGWFIRELGKIAKTIVICGNHDYNMENTQRTDSLMPVFAANDSKNMVYLDYEMGFSSGAVEDDNVVWCLFSTFDDFQRPEVEKEEGKTYVGLIHADINGASTDAGRVTETGLGADHFEGMDFVIAGHIHKRQEIRKNGTSIVYCGSLIQKDFGENISGHGGVLWDVEKKTWEPFDIPNPNYGYVQMRVRDIEDLTEDREEIVNL